MPAIDIDDETVQRLPLFAGLDRAVSVELINSARLERLAPGTILFRQDEIATHIHLLISGIVELSRIEERRECGVLLASTGDLFMPVAALYGEPYLTSARILSTARILVLETDTVREQALRNPALAMRLVELVGGQWRMAVRHILDLKCRSAPQRLASFLLRLVDEEPGRDWAELFFPKRHLAARVGMTAETLSRALQLLAENGLHLRGRRILVKDRALIETFCGPDPYPSPRECALGVNAL